VLRTLEKPPKVLWQTPRRFEDMFEALRALAQATGTEHQAEAWIVAARRRLERVADRASRLPRVRVAFLEWVEPLYCGGHWVPQMLEWAGARDANARDGGDSVRIAWENVLAAEPEVIIVAPCGFETQKALQLASTLRERPGWHELPAVVTGKVFAVDANAYFARPGPRLVDAVELLAHLVHPEHFAWEGPEQAYASVAAD
jgi:iron complex transport system substrate-binding protein